MRCTSTRPTSPSSASRSARSQEGIASWYGPGFHGKPTASGEIYDMHALTAAHRTLPLGTMVEVRNLENGRTTTARINDRGPYRRRRIIDLSLAAAEALGIDQAGLARVRLTVIGSPVARALLGAGRCLPGRGERASAAQRARAALPGNADSNRIRLVPGAGAVGREAPSRRGSAARSQASGFRDRAGPSTQIEDVNLLHLG